MTLLCHAPTAATREAAFPADEPLDAKGRTAAVALAGRVAKASCVLTSPAKRATQTAAAMGLRPRTEDALRDCDYGRWAGFSLADIAEAEPEAVARWLADPDAAPHGGESMTALVGRVAGWLGSGGIKGRTLAVTHAAVMRAAVVHVLGAPVRSFWRLDVVPLSIIELRRNGLQWSLHASQITSVGPAKKA